MSNNKILKFLPPSWTHNVFASSFVLALSRPLEQVYYLARKTLYDVTSPAIAPVEWLPWLSYIVAIPNTLELTDARRRALVPIALDVWSSKGTPESVERWLQAVAGVDATVTHLTGLGFIAGVSLAGDVCGVSTPFWTYHIQIPLGSLTPEELTSILDPVVPAFCVHTLEYI